MTSATAASQANPSSAASGRVTAIDLIRGAVMVIMAIDHVRVFSGLPGGGPTPGIFFTRWITHFCAPAFIFLAGTSAFFYGRRHPDLGRHLVVRGLWLIFLELTILRLGWTFNFDYGHHEMAGVIWVIGWSMIVLAAIHRLPIKVIAVVGLVIIAGHDLMDSRIGPVIAGLGQDPISALWRIGYVGFFAGPIRFGADGPNLIVLYSLIPWIGVMAAGYAFGSLFTLEPARRNRLCLMIGLGAIVLFLVLRGWNLYGDPNPWHSPVPTTDGEPQRPALLSFLNTSKYPASFLFLLMTLGPIIGLIPLVDGARGWLADRLVVFGRVPFFYYMLHIPLIHGLAILVSLLRDGAVNPWLFTNHPMGNPPPPDGYTWNLALLYAVWAAAILLLYPACRWFAALKLRRKDWWLSYL
ncbi:MAG: heparan-alpha-glucosaminide N-acetyltransferase domain-containing protein [Gemmatimonadota bacterium]